MCGIAGIVSIENKTVWPEELWKMCNTMTHRGPDDEGFYFSEGVGLGMRRLSIIDLKNGRQPVSNEDGSIWLVMNGEIYNYRELRRELESLGHVFYTSTDTETIVHLYEEYGDSCVNKLRGMFVFALWDLRTKRLFIARDRIGIKPLYYTSQNGRFAFASELKALFQLPEIKRDLNWSSVNHLFAFLTTSSSESIVEGVHKLEPGHVLTLSENTGIKIRRYWDVSFIDNNLSERDCIIQLREILNDSVKSHLVSDVPVGAFLSGGIDSSAVVATMSNLTNNPVKTFSIGFHEKEFDESSYARQVADHFGTDHYELIVNSGCTDILEDIAWHLDEPFGDPSSIPTYLVSKLAAEHVKVVLSGDGGDELFAGYDKYLVESREKNYQKIAYPLRALFKMISQAMPEGTKGKNFLRHFSMVGDSRYLDALTIFQHEQQQNLLSDEMSDNIRRQDSWRAAKELLSQAGYDWLSSLQYYDLHRYLPLDILTKVDRMSMAHSLETRVPLLDHKLVEFAATIPPDLRLRNSNTKYIFKQALRGILPDEVIDRPKKGFGVPLGGWFRGTLSTFLRDHLLSDRCRQRGIFNYEYVNKLIQLHENGRPLDLHLWTLLSFELWCRAFIDNHSSGISNFDYSAYSRLNQYASNETHYI